MDTSELVGDVIPALLTPGVWRYFAAHILEPEAQVALCILARLALEMSDHDLYAYLIDQHAPPPSVERRTRTRRQDDAGD